MINCVQEISDASDNETDEDGDDGGSNKGLTHAEEFAALERRCCGMDIKVNAAQQNYFCSRG